MGNSCSHEHEKGLSFVGTRLVKLAWLTYSAMSSVLIIIIRRVARRAGGPAMARRQHLRRLRPAAGAGVPRYGAGQAVCERHGGSRQAVRGRVLDLARVHVAKHAADKTCGQNSREPRVVDRAVRVITQRICALYTNCI